MTKPNDAVAATGNWPIPEDRKSAVVATDPTRGILDKEQATAAAQGGQHIDTKIDTPDPKDPLVGGLAADAKSQTQESADNYEPAASYDPTLNGETAARKLDPYINNDEPATGVVSAQDVIDGTAPSPKAAAAAQPSSTPVPAPAPTPAAPAKAK